MLIAEVLVILLCTCFYGSFAEITCLSCTGVIQPRYCTNIRHCPQHSFCGVQKYLSTNGRHLFDVDCVTSDICPHNQTMLLNNQSVNYLAYSHDHVTCGECCSHDLCNQQGCGEIGYPKQRGPVCYSCKQELDPASCDVISVCRTDEICAVIRHELFGDNFYESRCLSKYDCLTSLSETFGRRKRQAIAAPCAPCCESDMCNNNCDQGTSTTFSTSTTSTTIPTTTMATLDSEWHEFVFTFFPAYLLDDGRHPYVKVMVVSIPGDVVDVVLPANLGNRAFIVNQTGLLEFNISKEAYTTTNTLGNKAIIVRSSAIATVFTRSTETFLNEGFLVFPSSTCSNHYIVPSYPPFSTKEHSSIGIVSLFQDNHINIEIRTTSGQIMINGASYGNGGTFNLDLQKHETFGLAHVYDLTGTEIRSSKPVCVTAGSPCGVVLQGYDRCSRLEEMILPVKYFATRFIVPSLQDRPGSKIRILSSNDNTTLTWYTGHTARRNKLILEAKGSFKELDVSNDMTYIESSSPVTVVQYVKMKSPNSNLNNAFMMLIPGDSQNKYDYDFAVSGADFISYVTVIIPSIDISGLLLDGNVLSILPGSRNTLFVGNLLYEAFAVSVSPGAHNMKHTNLKTFGLFVYGSTNAIIKKGYGYPAGVKLI